MSEGEPQSVHDRVVYLLNQAQLCGSDSSKAAEKVQYLRQVQELVIFQQSDLLDSFLDEILAFQVDQTPEIRKFVVAFIEEAGKKDIDMLPKVIPNLTFLLTSDTNPNVLKRVILTLTHLYPLAMKWVAGSKITSDAMETTWEQIAQLKGRILPLTDGDNEGVKTQAIKFLETLILCQTSKTQFSEGKPDSVALGVIPRDHRFLSYRKTETEGKSLFEKLLELIRSSHISSVNLMTSMGCLVNIARQRPDCIEKAIMALEALHVNLPPTLAKSQVSSVRKALKMHLLSLLRHPSSSPYQPQITTLLMDLGASQGQVLKALPSGSELKKRSRRPGEDGPTTSKKMKQDEEEREDEDDDAVLKKSAIDVTAEYIYPRLRPQTVADIVLMSMIGLPDQMPPQFQASYTPIAAAGTEAQKRHLCRLIATQMSSDGIGPGMEQLKKEAEVKERNRNHKPPSEAYDVPATPAHHLISESKPGSAAELKKKAAPVYGVPTQGTSKRLHQKGLIHMARMLDTEQLLRMSKSAFERIENAEKRALQGGKASSQQCLLVRMVCRLKVRSLEESLREYILKDQKGRGDLAVLWVYEAYTAYHRMPGNSGGGLNFDEGFDRYDRCLCSLLQTLFRNGEHKESLFHKLLLEAPLITPNALEILKLACMDSVYGLFCLSTLKEMIETRPKQRTELLFALLDFTCFEQTSLRTQSLNISKELYGNLWIAQYVQNFVGVILRHLLDPVPPAVLFGIDRGRPENPGKWDEGTIKSCLYLLFFLLPLDPQLIHELAKVYVDTSSDIKRVILRQLEVPIKAVGMHSPQLLALVEFCPEGAETLVTRIVHLLTERSPPTAALVARVRDLYRERVPDVRCLIPVLTGLNKAEILSALPKLTKLNPNVVKEVFNRLLFGKSLETGQPPMTPTELLVILHIMETKTTDDVKAIILAMNLLIGMKQVYTKEVLAGVIQQLLDTIPLPPLMMRTVIQALGLFPTLSGFVLNVLQRLIVKQVWKYPKVWEGFVKCCQKLAPLSFQMVLQLPPQQVQFIVEMCPEMRLPLLEHVKSLSSHQQGMIPEAVMNIIEAHSTVTSLISGRRPTDDEALISAESEEDGEAGNGESSADGTPINSGAGLTETGGADSPLQTRRGGHERSDWG